MTVDVVNQQNEKVGSLDLRDEVFGGRIKTDLIHESVVRANAAERRGTHATKTRAMVSGSGVMTSATLRPCSRTKSVAAWAGPRMNDRKRPRLRCVPSSLRRIKSPSETMPTSFPAASTTGSPLMCRRSIVVAASTIVVCGVTVITGRVMI